MMKHSFESADPKTVLNSHQMVFSEMDQLINSKDVTQSNDSLMTHTFITNLNQLFRTNNILNNFYTKLYYFLLNYDFFNPLNEYLDIFLFHF